MRERPGFTLEETLVDSLAAKRALLLIDNAEHLLPQVATDIARLREAGGPKLLVTSRERLQLQGEHAWAVPSLDDHDGPALFTARARALRPAFRETPAIAELCARLDNLPLALELAAARVPIFSPEQLLERLGKGVDLKGGRDADPRQQTLDATIRWSYDLLAPEERRLFVRLAVFAGGCTYEAAEAVCAADVDTLQSLIDKSLVRSREAAGSARYWMLETIREFAVAELEASGEADALRLRHAEFFTAFAERADPHLRHGPDQQGWVERVAADYDNVRAAMGFALEHDLTLALRLVGRITFFLWLRGGFAEARAWLDAILPRAAGQPLELLGRAHECAAAIAERIGDIAGQARHSDAAYAAFAAAGDEQGMADALRERGKAASARGDVVRADAIYTELAELAERIGDRWNGAIALNNLGDIANQSGDWERAVELCGRSSVLRRELGDEWGMALALCNVAFAELRLGRLSSAASSLRVALDTSMKIDAKTVVRFLPRRLRRACGGAGKDARGGASRRRGLATPGGARLGPERVRGRLVRASGRIDSRVARRRRGRRDPARAGAVARRGGGARARRNGRPRLTARISSRLTAPAASPPVAPRAARAPGGRARGSSSAGSGRAPARTRLPHRLGGRRPPRPLPGPRGRGTVR